MRKPERIKLNITQHTIYMEGVRRSGGFVQSETKAVDGFYRNISGKKANVLTFTGKIAPADKRYAWGILNSTAGKVISFTAGDTLFTGYVLTDMAIEFKAGHILGDISIELREADE